MSEYLSPIRGKALVCALVETEEAKKKAIKINLHALDDVLVYQAPRVHAFIPVIRIA